MPEFGNARLNQGKEKTLKQSRYPSRNGQAGGYWNSATFAAVLVMILTLPWIFNHGSSYLHPFIVGQWGDDLGNIAFWGAWAVILPTLFSVMRTSLNSSFGMLAMWIIERFLI